MGRVLIVEDNSLIALEILQFVPYSSRAGNIRRCSNKGFGELVFPIAKDLDAKGIPYIFLTSYSAAAIPAQHRHQPLVSKPYSPEHLLVQMRQFLG
jgi:CheY-like chemotaxis protein